MRSRFVSLGLAFCCVTFGLDKPDAADLVARVRAHYAKATRFHFVVTGETTQTRPDGKVTTDGPEQSVFAGEPPGKGRYEGSMLGKPCLLIFDGNNYFAYSKDSNRYFKGKAAPPDTQIGDLDDLTGEQTSAFLMLLVRGVMEAIGTTFGIEKATVIGDERLNLDQRAIDCWVVEIKGIPGLVTTWWVDKSRLIVRRIRIVTETSVVKSVDNTVFNVASLDEPISADLFKFSPPVGAMRVSKIADLDFSK